MPLAPPITEIQQPAVGIYGLPIGASAGPMVLLTAAQIRAIAEITAPDLSGYVPYTGATANVNLGTRNLVTTGTLGAGATTVGALTCGAITASGTITASSGNITTNSGQFIANASGSNMILLNSAGTVYGSIGNDAGDKWSLGYKATTATTLGTPVLTWTASGFVGINKVSPTVALDVTGAITASGAVVCAGITSTSGVDVQALLRCDSFRIDQTPTSEVVVCTHTITVSVNGTNYKIPCVAA